MTASLDASDNHFRWSSTAYSNSAVGLASHNVSKRNASSKAIFFFGMRSLHWIGPLLLNCNRWDLDWSLNTGHSRNEYKLVNARL